MEMTFYKEKISKHIWRILGVGDACMYYIEGNKKGVLIDTAYGVGDLRSYIENQFEQPYDVLLTHGHWDHANGAGQWKKVYLNERDRDIYQKFKSVPFRRTALRKTITDIDEYPSDCFVKEFEGTFLDLKEGMIFELGDVNIKVIETPGHTQGIISVLVIEDRVLMLGDACGEFTFMFREESSSIAVYCDTLRKIKALSCEYDRILRQHGSFESPLSLIDDNLEVAKEILNGTDDHIPWNYMGQDVFIAKKIDPKIHKRADGRSGNIVYADDKVR